jgi:hypothetical protein
VKRLFVETRPDGPHCIAGTRLEDAWSEWVAQTSRTRWVLLSVSRKRQLLGRRMLLVALAKWAAATTASVERAVKVLRR